MTTLIAYLTRGWPGLWRPCPLPRQVLEFEKELQEVARHAGPGMKITSQCARLGHVRFTQTDVTIDGKSTASFPTAFGGMLGNRYVVGNSIAEVVGGLVLASPVWRDKLVGGTPSPFVQNLKAIVVLIRDWLRGDTMRGVELVVVCESATAQVLQTTDAADAYPMLQALEDAVKELAVEFCFGGVAEACERLLRQRPVEQPPQPWALAFYTQLSIKFADAAQQRALVA